MIAIDDAFAAGGHRGARVTPKLRIASNAATHYSGLRNSLRYTGNSLRRVRRSK
jgi:hypothetical protein